MLLFWRLKLAFLLIVHLGSDINCLHESLHHHLLLHLLLLCCQLHRLLLLLVLDFVPPEPVLVEHGEAVDNDGDGEGEDEETGQGAEPADQTTEKRL